MVKTELIGNKNYAVSVVAVGEPHDLPGLDNLVGVSIFGLQALTTRGIRAGDLRLLFVSEAQIGERYAHENNLNRKAEFNKTDETGFLEQNRRVRAIRLRKHTSNALLMPLSSLDYTGLDTSQLKPGDSFDTVGGETIVQKYELPKTAVTGPAKGPKIRERVDQHIFKPHLDSEHLFRNWHKFSQPVQAVVSQKIHGCAWRMSNLPVPRDKGWLERTVVNKWLRISTPDTEYQDIVGSRRVIKGQGTEGWYKSDVWSAFAERLKGRIPQNYVLYGELVGWTPDGAPIQRNYAYDVADGDCDVLIYRVAAVNNQGLMADLSWDGVKEFAASLGLRTVPEFERIMLHSANGRDIEEYLTERYFDKQYAKLYEGAITLSDSKTVDEGVCVRVDTGMVPHIYKLKAPGFLEHETKQLDSGEIDVESAA